VEKRIINLNVRLQPWEYEVIRQSADAAQMSISNFVRTVLLEQTRQLGLAAETTELEQKADERVNAGA
jgi:uncharacterized protein (DUF1778 family)